MAIKRIVDTGFWTDDKVVDAFSPEDRYFMLYLMTNPHSTQLGIYKLNKKLMAFELGYSVEAVIVLLERFQKKYKMIVVSDETNEIAILNYLKYSIVKGGKPVEDLLQKEIGEIKNKTLICKVFNHISKYDNLNQTVLKVIENSSIINNDNDNDNDNEESYHDTSNDSHNESGNESIDDSRSESISKSDVNYLVDSFNMIVTNLPKVTKMTDARRRTIKSRLKEYDQGKIEEVFRMANESNFLCGMVTDFKASFDWIMKPGNFVKILEGNYANRNKDGKQTMDPPGESRIKAYEELSPEYADDLWNQIEVEDQNAQ